MAVGRKVLKTKANAKKFHFKFAGVEQPANKSGRFYPADDVVKAKGPAPVRNAPKVRASISAGSVVVNVAGRFKGKRVVVLKVLGSGLLLVSGPYATNGVALRRVNQKYVIATSTKVALTGVDVSKIDDNYFSRTSKTAATKDTRRADQAKVDAALSANISKVAQLNDYLRNKFSLRNGDKPHLLKF